MNEEENEELDPIEKELKEAQEERNQRDYEENKYRNRNYKEDSKKGTISN